MQRKRTFSYSGHIHRPTSPTPTKVHRPRLSSTPSIQPLFLHLHRTPLLSADAPGQALGFTLTLSLYNRCTFTTEKSVKKSQRSPSSSIAKNRADSINNEARDLMPPRKHTPSTRPPEPVQTLNEGHTPLTRPQSTHRPSTRGTPP